MSEIHYNYQDFNLKLSEREEYDIGAQEDETISTASQWTLPCKEFHGLWENLVYDSNLKDQLLSYANTALMFSDRQVNSHIVSCNRVVLLHGPPGTGKTSLCRALAQKLAIRLGDRYLQTLLIEINSHSLFSKWFSESGKLVHRMFEDIRAKTRNPELLICVLIDEVESLTAARSAAIKGTDPSDAIRVVNAFLTQIDRIKKHSNVLILTTSNVTGAIDVAFVDRADIKHYIGVPSAAAAYSIYRSCFQELSRVGIIKTGEKLLDLRALDILRMAENPITRLSLRLLDIARQSNGFSGRTLRKLPFLAYALYFKGGNVTAEMFLDMLEAVVQKQHKDRENMDVEQ
ncbi:pachytene checkpoint protein 2 homolog [Corticium candelabrum]|uniref:pachytene checkpoint protein 2 homolog n=1 Tax=Corticium candelabrum TaxID=121492 RepID=UPI002E263EF1|nr:pachytene checkpoint protein 2 homolog [Corticium candelabrum]